MKKFLYLNMLILASLLLGCQNKNLPDLPPVSYTYNAEGKGPRINIEFTKGKSFNHPVFAAWIEDEKGNFVQTIYVSESIGKGVFLHGDSSSGKWMPGEIRRPAALPYWSHKRNIKASDGLYIPDSKNPIPDAYTGPTPTGNFILTSNLDMEINKKFSVYFEINQTWDWNEYWTNTKYPDDEEYKTSCQPALVYRADINPDDKGQEYEMKVIGHSHFSGKTGELFTDLSTITSALSIVENIRIRIK
jgi:hypothetical protein